MLFVTVVDDLLYQPLQGFLAGVPARAPVGRQTGYVDASAVVSFTARATGVRPAVVTAVLLAVLAVDLFALVAVFVRVVRRSSRGRCAPSVVS